MRLQKRVVYMTLLATLLLLAGLEAAARFAQIGVGVSDVFNVSNDFERIVREPLARREKNNKFIKHNIYLLKNLEHPGSFRVALLGTSRTKALSPSRFGYKGYFNAGGNSYNEMTYGLLVDAEALYAYLPNLDKIYVEASLLQRRPPAPQFIVEEDHKTYLHILKRFVDERRRLQGAGFELFLDSGQLTDFKFVLFEDRHKYILSKLLQEGGEESVAFEYIDDSSVFNNINSFGERLRDYDYENNNLKPAISSEHPKVQRLKDIPSNSPYDQVFAMLALWGEKRGVEVVFFQPPVRSDLQSFQMLYGLELHNSMLLDLSLKYGVKVINMNFQGNGYSERWNIFSDEDHLTTCLGNASLLSALEYGESIAGVTTPGYVKISSDIVSANYYNDAVSYCRSAGGT